MMGMETAASINSKPATSGTGRTCKVIGCQVDLEALGKPYCLKKRLCPAHMRADAVTCEGEEDMLLRFCQQCGKLEPLRKFEGKKRSCRKGLEKRRLRECVGARDDDKEVTFSAEETKDPVATMMQHQQQQTAVSAIKICSNTQLPSDSKAHCDPSEKVAAVTAAVPADSLVAKHSMQQYQQQYYTSCNACPSMEDPRPAPSAAAAGKAHLRHSAALAASPSAASAAIGSLIDCLLDEELVNCVTSGNNGGVTTSSADELECLLESELLAAAAAAAVGRADFEEPSLRTAQHPAAGSPATPATYSPTMNNHHEQQQQTTWTAATTNFMGPVAGRPCGAASRSHMSAGLTLDIMQQKLMGIQRMLLKLQLLRKQQLSTVQGYYPATTGVQGSGEYALTPRFEQSHRLGSMPYGHGM